MSNINDLENEGEMLSVIAHTEIQKYFLVAIVQY